ncbi:MAG: hypothetical protein KC646_10465 [Candidatus Cloacimonetes bacterium]|nr:hypothetical protein [Candidatus Cloacimonadota bacterium]
MDNIFGYLGYWFSRVVMLMLFLLMLVLFFEMGTKYYRDYKFSQQNIKLATEGDNLWSKLQQHHAFHKYWLWLKDTNLDISDKKASIILSRLVYFLDKHKMNDLSFKLFSNATALKLKISIDPNLKKIYEAKMKALIQFENKLKDDSKNDLSSYLKFKGKNAPDYLIDTGIRYWKVGYEDRGNDLIKRGIQGLIDYPKELLTRNVNYMQPIKHLIDIDKCKEASHLFKRVVTSEYVLNRYKIKVENCSKKLEVLLSLILTMEENPGKPVNFEAFGFDDFREAAEELLKLNLDVEANRLAIHEDSCNKRCGPTRQNQLSRLYRSIGKTNLVSRTLSKDTSINSIDSSIIESSDSTSDLLKKIREGAVHKNLNETLNVRLSEAILDNNEYDSLNKKDDILKIFLLKNSYDRALALSDKYKVGAQRDERLMMIVKSLSKGQYFDVARRVLKRFSTKYSFYGEAMSILAVELYRNDQSVEAYNLISSIPNTHLNRELSFEKISNINIGQKKYKVAIDSAFKASQTDYTQKIEKALFQIIPKCNSIDQLEILKYTLNQMKSREEDYWHNKAKLKMVIGKYFISLGYATSGLKLIEDGLLDYPAIEQIVEMDLYLKKWGLKFVNQSKFIAVAINHTEDLYIFRRSRRIRKKTKSMGLKDGLFFYQVCELCKSKPIDLTNPNF